MSKYTNPLADLIKSKRLSLNMTQETLAANAKVSLRNISQIESSGHIPKSKTLDALKQALSISDEQWEKLDIESIRLNAVARKAGKIGRHVNEGRNIRHLLQGMLDTSDELPVSLSDILWMVNMEKQIGAPITAGTARCIFSDKKVSQD